MGKQRINPITGKPMARSVHQGVSNIENTQPNVTPIKDEYSYLRNAEGDDLVGRTARRGLEVGHDMYSNLAKDQSAGEQVGMVLTNLIPNIGLGIVENIGYIGELVTMPFQAKENRDFSNALTRFAQRNRNQFGTIFGQDDQLYLKNPEKVWDTSDSAWWLQHGGGLVESVAEFLVTGAGVGKVLGAGTKAMANSLKVSTKSMNIGNQVVTGAQAAQGIAQTANAATLAYTEGAMSGAQVYKDVYEWHLKNTKEHSIDTDLETYAKSKAAEAAATTVKLNTIINTALNFTSSGLFVKSGNALHKSVKRIAGETDAAYRARLKDIVGSGVKPSWGNTLKKLSGEGVQEAGEELTNVISEDLGSRQGIEGEEINIDNLLSAYGRGLTSEEGQLSMVLGAFGGIAQTGLSMNIPMHKGKDGKLHSSRANSLLSAQNFASDLLFDLDRMHEAKSKLVEAVASNDKAAIAQAKADMLAITSYRSFGNNASAELVQSFREIASTDNTNTLNDVEYIPKIDALSSEISEIEEQARAKANEATPYDSIDDLVHSTLGEDIHKSYTQRKEELEAVRKEADQHGWKTEAIRQGLAESVEDNDYRDLAETAISLIPKYQDLYNDSAKYVNQREIFHHQVVKENNKEMLRLMAEEKQEFYNLLEEASELGSVETPSNIDEALAILLGDVEIPEEKKQVYNFLKQQPEIMAKAKRIAKTIEQAKQNIFDANKKLTNLSSDKTQKQLKKKRKQAEELAEIENLSLDEKRAKLNNSDLAASTKNALEKSIKREEISIAREKLDKDISDIARKIRKSEKLTEEEQAIYDKNKINIDARNRALNRIEKARSEQIEEEKDSAIDTSTELENDIDESVPATESQLERAEAELIDQLKVENEGTALPTNTNQLLPYEGWNLISWLARPKKDTFDERTGTYSIEEKTNELHPNYSNQWLLDASTYKAGKRLVARVPDNVSDIPVYTDFNAKTKENFGDLRLSENDIRYVESVPIQLIDPDNGRVVGYIHDVNWVKNGMYPRNRAHVAAASVNILKQSEQVFEMRQRILNGETELTISERTAGYPFFTFDNKKIPTNEALGDANKEKYHFAVADNNPTKFIVGMEGTSKKHQTTNNRDEIKGSGIKPGQLVIIPPDDSGVNVAYPVRVRKFNQGNYKQITQNVADAINIWQIAQYHKNDKKALANALEGLGLREMYEKIRSHSNLGMDIATDEGLLTYIKRFVPTTNKPRIAGRADQYVHNWKTGKAQVFIDNQGSLYVVGAKPADGERKVNKITANSGQAEIDQIKDNLGDWYMHVDRSLLGKDMVWIDRDGQAQDSGSYANFLSNNTDSNIVAPFSEALNKRVWSIQSKVRIAHDYDDNAVNTTESVKVVPPVSPETMQIDVAQVDLSYNAKDDFQKKIDEINENLEEQEENEDDLFFNLVPEEKQGELTQQLKDSTFVIEGVPSALTQSFVNHLVNKMVRAVVAGVPTRSVDGKPSKLRELMDSYVKDVLRQVITYGDDNAKAHAQLMLNSFDVLMEKAGLEFSNLAGFKATQFTDENVEEEANEFNFYDRFDMEKDSKNSASLRAKMFLTDLELSNKDGLITLFGLDETLPNGKRSFIAVADYNTVYDQLMNILAGVEPDAQSVLDALVLAKQYDPYREKYPWLDSLIDKIATIDNLPDDLKQQREANLKALLSVVSKDRLIMEKPMIKQGVPVVQNVSEAVGYRVVKELWKNELKASTIVINNGTQFFFDKEVIKEILKEDENGLNFIQRKLLPAESYWLGGAKPSAEHVQESAWQHETLDEALEEMSKVFKDTLGITLDPSTFRLLLTEQQYKFQVDPATDFMRTIATSREGWFKYINDELKRIANMNTDTVSIEDHNLFGTAINPLAQLQAEVSNVGTSSSFIDNSKVLSSYVNRKTATQRAKDITNSVDDADNAGMLTTLNNTHFGKNHPMIAELIQYSTPSERARVFGLSHLSIGALQIENEKFDKITTLSHNKHSIMKFILWSSSRGQPFKKYTYQSMSDKSTQFVVKLPNFKRFTMNLDNTLDDVDAIDLYNYLVRPEVQRMLNYSGHVDIKGYNEGVQIFHMFPFLNTHEQLQKADGTSKLFNHTGELNPTFFAPDGTLTTKGEELILPLIKEHYTALVDKQVHDWLVDNNISNVIDFEQYSAQDEIADAAREVAFEYVADQLRANASIQALFLSDPNIYHKSATLKKARKAEKSKSPFQVWNTMDSEQKDRVVREIWSNQSKRLASEMAAGSQGANWHKAKHIQLSLVDKESESAQIEYLKKLQLVGISDYSEIEGTDAQEYTTWKEYLWIIESRGMTGDGSNLISPKDIAIVKEVLKNNKDITKLTGTERRAFKNVMFTPMKPVQVDTVFNNGIAQRVYVKSSAVPLIPQFTKGTQLDKLRVAMEKIEARNPNVTGVRAAYGTAIKVGNTTQPFQLWNEDGTIVDIDDTVLEQSGKVLNKRNMFIQQEIPFDENKKKINVVTQARKLLFGDMLDITIDGKPAIEVYKQFLKDWNTLSEESKIELERELADGKRFEQVLKSSADGKSFTQNELAALHFVAEDNKFEIPLWGTPSWERNERLLVALYTKNVIKQKMPGSSYTLMSEEGLDTLDNNKNNIIYTSAWNGKELLPAHEINGVYHESQVFVPSKFKVGNKTVNLFAKRDGEFLFIEETDEGYKLREDKFDDDLLKIVGFRIPNQGHASMSSMRIAGFLPPEMGDVMIATRDLTKQMGSDFDADKTYTYSYNYEYKDGKFVKSSKDKKQEAQNNIIDTYHKVLRTKEVQKRMFEPLAFGLLKYPSKQARFKHKDTTLADEVNNAGGIADFFAGIGDNDMSPHRFSPLSGMYQRDKFINSTAGKGGIGVFSSSIQSNAILQASDVKWLAPDDRGNLVPIQYRLGEFTASSDTLNVATSLSGRLKSDVFMGFQSASVDNENEQILGKINVNSATFSAINAMIALGFEEDIIVAFLKSPAVKRVVDTLLKQDSRPSTYSIRQIFKTMLDDYTDMDANTLYQEDSKQIFLNAVQRMDNQPAFTKLVEMIRKDSTDNQSDNDIQIGLVLLFESFTQLGNKLSDIDKIANIDSSNITGDFISVTVLLDALLGDADSNEKGPRMVNIHSLLNVDGVDTVAGVVTKHGLEALLERFGKHSFIEIFNGELNSVLKQLSDNLIIPSSLSISGKTKTIKEIADHMRSAIMTHSSLHDDKNLQARRQELMYSIYSKKGKTKSIVTDSLATFIDRELATSSNKFIRALKTDKNSHELQNTAEFGDPDFILYNASRREDDIENLYADFIELYTSDEVVGQWTDVNVEGSDPIVRDITGKELAEMMIEYFYITGAFQKAVQFSKIIPVPYLKASGIAESLHQMTDKNNELANDIADFFESGEFVEQFVQHHPERTINAAHAHLVKDLPDGIGLSKALFNNQSSIKMLSLPANSPLDQLPKYVHSVNKFTGNVKLYRQVGAQDVKLLEAGLPPQVTYIEIETRGYAKKQSHASRYREYDMQKTLSASNVHKTSIFGQIPNTETNHPILNRYKNNSPIKISQRNEALLNKYATNTETVISNSDEIRSELEKRLTALGEKETPANAALIAELLNYLPSLKIAKLSIGDYAFGGMYSARQNAIYLNSKRADSMVLVEEMMHKMVFDNLTKPQFQDHFDRLRDAMIVLREKHPDIFTSLSAKIVMMKNKSAPTPKFTSDEIKYRGLTDVVEFTYAVLTDSTIQAELNTIPYSKDVSFLKKILNTIMDIINDAFTSLTGIEVKSDSLLQQALADALYVSQPTHYVRDTTNSFDKSIDINKYFNLDQSLSSFNRTLDKNAQTKLNQLITDGTIKRKCD